MLRKTAATVLGLLVGFTLVGVVEVVGHHIWPPPAGIDFMDPEVASRYVATMPFGALAWVVLAWLAGSLCGSFAAAWTARTRWPGWIVGTLVLVATAVNLLVIRHPLWMAVAGPALVIAGCAAGTLLGVRRAPAARG